MKYVIMYDNAIPKNISSLLFIINLIGGFDNRALINLCVTRKTSNIENIFKNKNKLSILFISFFFSFV
jgi:hypothetical protein